MMTCEKGFKETEIGPIPEDWYVGKLADFSLKIGSGATPRGGSNVYVESGISFIRSQNVYDSGFNEDGLAFIDENSAEKLNNVTVRNNDILFNITGDSICRCSIVPNHILPARVNQHVSIIRTNNKLYYQFLFFYLNLHKTKEILLSFDAGGTRKAITKKNLENLPNPIPSLHEQIIIGDFLGVLNDKIELLQETNETLEQIAQALFKHWFIDFKFPDENGNPYRSSGGAMKPSPMGSIPEDWGTVEHIADISEMVNYGYTQSASDEKVGPKFLRVTDINKGDWINWQDVPYCEITDKDKDKYTLKKGDIVVARMADPGKLEIFESDIDAVFASYLIRVRLENPDYAYYLYYLMKSIKYQNFILGISSGSVQKNVNAKRLTTGFPICLPDEKTISKFNDIIFNLRKKLDKQSLHAQSLTELRDLLLPRLMSGKIRVPAKGGDEPCQA